MISDPLVSVSCLSFNHANYIRQCFEGILAQKTNFPFEIVVYDDASTDGTIEIIQEYIHKYPDLFNVFFQKENQYSKGVRGIAPRFNFPRCRGKYIAFCEGDDFWIDPDKLQKQVDFLEENQDFTICCTNYSEVDQDGKLLKENIWDGFRLSPVITHEMILEHYKPKILTSMFRKSAFKNGFPNIFSQTFNTDNFLCAIATENGPAGFLNFNSGCYRVHNQGVWSGKSEIRQFEMQLDTFFKMKGYFKNQKQQRSIDKRIYSIERKLSRIYAKEKEIGKSLDLIKRMMKVDPKDSIKVFIGNIVAFIR
ncbi:glycosyltransferase [Algoriphagus algorifonticola]|uniref:glycosyltransferase n=1 Tax=Algoriphagus algorifonticola TaxID=2593007 RepID=UPI00119CE89A|nr:glycosyltransferase [Algoriphagus algorifonticola]